MTQSRNQFTHPWPKDDIKDLKKMWPKSSREEIEKRFKYRSWPAITKKAGELNVRRSMDIVRQSISKSKQQSKPFKAQLLDRTDICEDEELRPRTDINTPKDKLVKVIVAADQHIPFEDKLIVNLFNQFISDEQPEYIILAGDFLDCFQLSSFRKTPLDKTSFRDELGKGKKFLSEIRLIVPNAEIYYIEGNHEFRLRKYLIDWAKELYFIPSLRLSSLLDCDKYNVTYVPCRHDLNRFSHNYININNVYIGHFDKVVKHGGYTARLLRDEMGVSLIQSHTHRMGMSARTFIDGVRIGWEIGCMCQDPTYSVIPDWQKGFGILYLKGNQNMFYPIVIEDYKFISPSGKEYTAL